MADELDAMLSDPRHPGWGTPPLPAWVRSFRESQKYAIRAAVEAFESDTRIVIMSAPTGSGKTIIGEAVRRALRVHGLYVCVDKGLQDQVLEDFDYARVLKGRANYPTLDAPDRFGPPERVSCDDCTKKNFRDPCKWCSDTKRCPYSVAKSAADTAELAVLNTAYLLAEANTGGTFSERSFVIADECDRLEGALLSYVTVTVGRRRLEGWKIDPLPAGCATVDAIAWIEGRVIPALDGSIEELLSKDPEQRELRTQRELRALRNLRGNLTRVLEELPRGGWVTAQSTGAVEFKPVRVRPDDAEASMWRHAERWLLMSGTVMSAAHLMEDLGIQDQWSWVEVDLPSPFPVENRPVHLCGVTPVVRANPQAAEQLADVLPKLLARHEGERVLVHTVSFKLQRQLEELLPYSPRHLWYRGSADRASILAEYLRTPGAVLFAPALERGLDLPDDACRAVVVCKVPYPDLSDVQVAARMAMPGGNGWYQRQTLRSMVQMTGRGVRHERDTCMTYVLDRQADVAIARSRNELPRWWLEAVVKGWPQ